MSDLPPPFPVVLGAVLVAAALAACGNDDAPRAAPPSATAAPVPRAPVPGDSLCPRDGLWKACALEDRIGKAGLSMKAAGDTMTVPYLDAPGLRYRVGKSAALIVFFYRDSSSAARDVAPLDTMRLGVKGDTVGVWGSQPTDVIRSSNMIAVLLDASPLQTERIRLAITAGAPQPYTDTPQTLPLAPVSR
ncbi:MAG TPA: hypothetical protein VE869_12510 [Gemmatimonas sp.]|nr:hypothetical protein [Gemmatimonas sp.]